MIEDGRHTGEASATSHTTDSEAERRTGAASEESMSGSVVGVWRLTSFVMEDLDTHERSEPFGPSPRGTLMLHPDGRMAALLTPGERPMPVTEADRASAFGKLVAYAGRYRLEPPDRFVTTVDVAWIESWIGTEQLRTYRLDGDTLAIFTPPGPMPKPDGGEATVRAVLSWERETATPVNG